MMKNPNKTAGNWGALKNKPQNLVPFSKGGKVKVTAGGEKHVIYKKTTKRGEGKVGNIMVNHPTKDKGVWDTIDLTKKSGAKTIKQGVASTKKWHKENPYNDMKKQLTKKQAGGPTKIKIKSNSGNYKIKNKFDTEGNLMKNTRVNRTVKGIVSGAPSAKQTRSNYEKAETLKLEKRKDLTSLGAKPSTVNDMYPTQNYRSYIKQQKKGGSIKKKK